MLRWKIEKKVVSEVYLDGHNIINPWGIETADSSAFFSLEEGVGYRHRVIHEKYISDNKNYYANLIVEMYEGKWELNVNDRIIDDNMISRKAEILCLEDSFFMDFALRFRFKREFIEYAEIGGNKYYHENSNIYCQYPERSVFLKGKGFNLTIDVKDLVTAEKMNPVMYVRNRTDEWIVHARMLPKEWDKEVIKLCNPWYRTRPLPQRVSDLLLRSTSIKDSLWYRGEVSPYKSKLMRFICPSAFPMTKLKKGEKLMWKVIAKIDRHEK